MDKAGQAADGCARLAESVREFLCFVAPWLPPSRGGATARQAPFGALGVECMAPVKSRPPQPLPAGRGRTNGGGLPRASARRLAFALGYHLIVLTGLRF